MCERGNFNTDTDKTKHTLQNELKRYEKNVRRIEAVFPLNVTV